MADCCDFEFGFKPEKHLKDRETVDSANKSFLPHFVFCNLLYCTENSVSISSFIFYQTHEWGSLHVSVSVI